MARERWAATSDEQKVEWQAKGRAAYEAKYPWRVGLRRLLERDIENGLVRPESCDRCGGDSRPIIDWDDEAHTGYLAGWRCYPCRKPAPPPFPEVTVVVHGRHA